MQNNGFAFTSNPYKNYRRMVLWARRNLECGKSVDWSGGITLLKFRNKNGYEEITSYRTGVTDLPHFWPATVISYILSPHITLKDRKSNYKKVLEFAKGKKFPLP